MISRAFLRFCCIFSIILPLCAASARDATTIVVFGDSLVAGYGLEQNAALPHKLEETLIEGGYSVNVINDGVSGDTTASGRGRINWTLKRHKPDIIVVVLGGNDVLRGFQPAQTKENMRAIIEAVQKNNVKLVVAPMQAAKNLGEEFNQKYNVIFGELAEEYDMALTPPILQDIFGNPALLQTDGIHPNPEGVKVMVSHLMPSLENLLQSQD